VASGAAVFLLIRWEQFLYSVEIQWALIFWPLHPLVQYAVAMLCPVCFCAVKDGWYGHLDSHREGVRWYSYRYPHCCRGVDVVIVE
jgi:hypothetical protein